MNNEEIKIDVNEVVEKLGMRVAQLEVQLAYEEVTKQYYFKEYQKLKAQGENKND